VPCKLGTRPRSGVAECVIGVRCRRLVPVCIITLSIPLASTFMSPELIIKYRNTNGDHFVLCHCGERPRHRHLSLFPLSTLPRRSRPRSHFHRLASVDDYKASRVVETGSEQGTETLVKQGIAYSWLCDRPRATLRVAPASCMLRARTARESLSSLVDGDERAPRA
jgi:hypothetical protein